jgi:hypothetical protein
MFEMRSQSYGLHGTATFRVGLPLTALLGFMLLALPGCSGCNSDPAAAQKKAAEEKRKKEEELKKKKKEKKKPDFEITEVRLRPGTGEVERTKESPGRQPTFQIKPGHWVNAYQPMKTNNFDFVGQLEATVLGADNQPLELDRTPFRLTTTRPAALPKGQQKFLDVTFFVPHTSKNVNVSSVLEGRSSGQAIKQGGRPFSAMPAYQYYFVVLAREPQRYGFVKVLDSVRAPWEDERSSDSTIYYQVIYPEIKKPLPVPSYSLTWTGTAYLLWDDVDPTLLSIEQQESIVDWLHWGGQIVISGPDSLDALRGSFLGPYLPATAGQARTYDDDDLREINATWTLRSRRKVIPPLTTTQPWSGVTLVKHENAQPVPTTGGLLVERQVGAGRIVVSAFRLDQRDLVNWKGLDGFINGCVLRRPMRRFAQGPFGGLAVNWASEKTERRMDPALATGLRYFSRDAGAATAYTYETEDVFDNFGMLVESREQVTEPTMAGGAASWNPMSPCSDAARESLREAAGIVVPQSSFVLWVLAAYLVVLVPLNWALFWAIGRVEWAWVAAPVIAVICSVLVIKLAQLDIGFARSQTEIAVLEVQGGYDRAHLTRYTALYTSLSTDYDVRFDDASAVAQPFPVDRDFRMLPGQTRSTVTFRRAEDVSLSGLRIASNTTGMIHSEHMAPLGGEIKLGVATGGAPQLVNGSKFDLKSAGVVRARSTVAGKTRIEYCWLGDIPRGESSVIAFEPADSKELLFAKERRVDDLREGKRLNLDLLYGLAQDPKTMKPGEVRLVARIDELLPGAVVEPAASQVRSATVVVAHLTPGDMAEPQTDANTRFDFDVRWEPDAASMSVVQNVHRKPVSALGPPTR